MHLLPLGGLGLNAFNHSWACQVTYMIPPPTLVPVVLSMFLVEYITDQLRLLILVAPCWIKAHWLPTVLSMLEDSPHQFPIVKDLAWMFPFTRCSRVSNHCIEPIDCSEMCVAQTMVLFSRLSGSGGG